MSEYWPGNSTADSGALQYLKVSPDPIIPPFACINIQCLMGHTYIAHLPWILPLCSETSTPFPTLQCLVQVEHHPWFSRCVCDPLQAKYTSHLPPPSPPVPETVSTIDARLALAQSQAREDSSETSEDAFLLELLWRETCEWLSCHDLVPACTNESNTEHSTAKRPTPAPNSRICTPCSRCPRSYFYHPTFQSWAK